MQKRYNRFKKLKVKMITKRKFLNKEEEEKEKEKKQLPKLQKPKVEAEFYNSSKECD